MKYIYSLLVVLSLFACNKETDNKEPLGKASDTIKLSTDSLLFNSTDSVKEVTTEGDRWEMGLILNGSYPLDYSKENLKYIRGNIGVYENSSLPIYENTPLKIEGDWFVISRELKKITVEVKPNETKQNRKVEIMVNDRNYFGTLTVTQSGN